MATVSGAFMVPSSASGSSCIFRAGDPYGPRLNEYSSEIFSAWWSMYGQNQLVIGNLEERKKGFATHIVVKGSLPRPRTQTSLRKVPFLNKDFLERQRKGEIIFAPYEHRSIKAEFKPGWTSASVDRYGPGYGWFSSADVKLPKIVGNCYPEDPWSSRPSFQMYIMHTQVNDATYENIVLGPDFDLDKCYPKEEIDAGLVTSVLAEANSGTYDLLTEIAELPETLKYLIGILRDIASALKAVRSKEVHIRRMFRNKKQTERSAYELADALASVWMQYRYAISPLAYSFEDIITTLENYKQVFAKYRKRVVVPSEPVKIPGLIVLSHDELYTTHRSIIKRSFSPEDIVDALLSLLKVNPLATAYELIPLSFVADWVVNIGDYITAMFNTISYSEQAACYSWKTEGSTTYGYANQEELPEGFHPPTLTLSYNSYNRIVIDPQANTGLTIDPSFNWKRQLDALALLWGPTKKTMKNLR